MFIKFASFAFIGVIGTMMHYLVLYILVESQGLNPVVASGYGALTGLLVNYILNYRLTFKSDLPHVQAFPKFALIALIGLTINLSIMAVLTRHIYYLYAQILATLIVLVWNFLINNFWTFQEAQTDLQGFEKPKTTSQRFLSGFGLLAAILIIRVLTLGFYPLYDPSESRYAEMGRKMLEVGDWVTPMIDYGVPFWGKPPLTIWLTALSLNVGGVNEFSARLPSFILGIVIFWVIFHLANFQRGADKARFAVIILASTVLFFVMSGTVAMDPCMSFGITLALASFWIALRGGRPFWGYLFFIGLSIGLLAKGPVSIVLSGITIGLWTAISREWSSVWKHIPWIKGSMLMLCISVPWFLIAEQKTPGFLEYFIIGEHWKRFTESGWKGDLYGVGHAHPYGMIWIYWLEAAFPWSLLFLITLINSLRRKEGVELFRFDDSWRLYCLLWMLAPLLFFTFSANIIWTYVLPGMPGFALLISDWLDQSKNRAAIALSVPVIFIGFVIAYHLPEMDFYKSQKSLVNTYLQQANTDEHLIYLDDRPYSAQFYTLGKALKLSGDSALQGNADHNFYVIRKDIQESLPSEIKTRLEPVKNYGRFMLFHARALDKK